MIVDSFSRDMSLIFTFPILIKPLSTSQNPEISFAIVDFPEPDSPTKAFTLPSSIFIFILFRTCLSFS